MDQGIISNINTHTSQNIEEVTQPRPAKGMKNTKEDHLAKLTEPNGATSQPPAPSLGKKITVHNTSVIKEELNEPTHSTPTNQLEGGQSKPAFERPPPSTLSRLIMYLKSPDQSINFKSPPKDGTIEETEPPSFFDILIFFWGYQWEIYLPLELFNPMTSLISQYCYQNSLLISDSRLQDRQKWAIPTKFVDS